VIISDTHRYLFVEQPHTACSAIEAELREYYGGRKILDKHATWADFLRVATPAQKRYFVFSGIRNPLDEAVSLYFKYKTDHNRGYSRARRDQTLNTRQVRIYEAVVDEQVEFGDYLRRTYHRAWDNHTLIYHKRMDQLIRFEHLQEDFSRTLARLGLEQIRPLPVVNKTGERGSYLHYYSEDIRPHAAVAFGPFMYKWGDGLPAEWSGIRVPRSALLAFRVRGVGRYLGQRYLLRRTNLSARLVRSVVKPVWRSAARLMDR
jgi:hypothetical protein